MGSMLTKLAAQQTAQTLAAANGTPARAEPSLDPARAAAAGPGDGGRAEPVLAAPAKDPVEILAAELENISQCALSAHYADDRLAAASELQDVARRRKAAEEQFWQLSDEDRARLAERRSEAKLWLEAKAKADQAAVPKQAEAGSKPTAPELAIEAVASGPELSIAPADQPALDKAAAFARVISAFHYRDREQDYLQPLLAFLDADHMELAALKEKLAGKPEAVAPEARVAKQLESFGIKSVAKQLAEVVDWSQQVIGGPEGLVLPVKGGNQMVVRAGRDEAGNPRVAGLSVQRASDDAIRAMVETACIQGWKTINVNAADPKVAAKLWLEAMQRGLEVKNFTPSADMLAQWEKVRSGRDAQLRDRITAHRVGELDAAFDKAASEANAEFAERMKQVAEHSSVATQLGLVLRKYKSRHLEAWNELREGRDPYPMGSAPAP